ncbi:hypothetical protein KAX17_17100, partial [Candidatus Bipolaricaulota bacterium]|nr:hypothetical protein [Candidatus Bipolaricaulota bacterium]
VVPPNELLEAYEGAELPLIARLVDGIHESQELSSLRDALLPRLLSGNLLLSVSRGAARTTTGGR